MSNAIVLDLDQFRPKSKRAPVVIAVGGGEFKFRPVMFSTSAPDPKSAPVSAWLGWLGDVLLDATVDELAAACRKATVDEGLESDVAAVLGVVAAFANAVQGSAEAEAERPTKPSSGSSRSTKRAATKSRSGSSRAPAGA